MKHRIGTTISVAAVAWLTAACQTVQTTGGGAVGVDRGQMMMVSAAEVEQASGKQYQQVSSGLRSLSS